MKDVEASNAAANPKRKDYDAEKRIKQVVRHD